MNTVVYPFTYQHDADTDLKSLLGGKGAGLNAMINTLGLPVPEGFTIPTHHTGPHLEAEALDMALDVAVMQQVLDLQQITGRTFGDPDKPLLVSVRSGAAISCPGMMDTLLNLGMNDNVVEGMAATMSPEFAWDSYRRFIQMYGTIVLSLDPEWFEERVRTMTNFFNARPIPAEASQILVSEFRSKVDFPQDPTEQLRQAILAVFRSWSSEKAIAYRDIEGIPHDLGTAVNVQRMVFGNLNDQSGTGVAFTRNPNTGDNEHFGDFLVNAQGEDVVDGSTNTLPLSDMSEVFPAQYSELLAIMETLESHYNDMCDIEFTIEDGQLYMLQTRIGKRSSLAEIRIVTDLLDAGQIGEAEAAERLAKAQELVDAKVEAKFNGELIGSGIGASGGTVVGKAYFDNDQAIAAANNGVDVVLIRHTTSPEDTKAMAKAVGILTASGGLVSHAAVVARSWDKTAVVGASDLKLYGGYGVIGDKRIDTGADIAINGETGEIMAVVKTIRIPPKTGSPIKSALKLEKGDVIYVGKNTHTKAFFKPVDDGKPSWHGSKFAVTYGVHRLQVMEVVGRFSVRVMMGLPGYGGGGHEYIINLRDSDGIYFDYAASV